MKEKILKIINSEGVSYLFYGILTTFVNYISFWLALQILGYNHILIVNTISFICALIFTYVTNKLFVFKSKSWSFNVIKKELSSFVLARIFSYFLEQAGLYLCADVWHFEKYHIWGIDGILISKVVLSFAVVLLNWVLSKFLIFNKKG